MPTLYCPRCGYNLTGLTQNVCPECGEGFDPDGLAKRQDVWLATKGTVLPQIILFPAIFAVIVPIIVMAFSILMYIAPSGLDISGAVMMFATVFAPPALHGYFLGKSYDASRRYNRDADDRTNPKPVWVYQLLFIVAESVLMIFYFVGGYTIIAMNMGFH